VRVCALIAAFNEEATIASVVAGVGRRAPASAVVVVDDGSTDRTGELAAAAGATVVRHVQNRGKGAAIRTGLAHVLAGPHSHVLFIDADLQHDPDDIPRLLSAGERAGCDMVIAERAFMKGSMPTSRFYSNRIGSWILSRFIGIEVADSQSGFRLIRCDCLRPLRLTATGYEIETEILIKLVRRHASLCRVSIAARYDGARSRLRSFRDTFRTCMLAVWYRYLSSP
jgi:glycosyltransferase involved in cell wall biosynthesis